MKIVALTKERIDPEAIRRPLEAPHLGGVVVFAGEVRSVTAGEATAFLDYEAYEEMALKQMNDIADQAEKRWNANVGLVHRLGKLLPGEIAVVTVAACAHRVEAFECCKFLIDTLKADVPIWKSD